MNRLHIAMNWLHIAMMICRHVVLGCQHIAIGLNEVPLVENICQHTAVKNPQNEYEGSNFDLPSKMLKLEL